MQYTASAYQCVGEEQALEGLQLGVELPTVAAGTAALNPITLNS